MMKRKLFKPLTSLVTALIMTVMLSMPAFAALPEGVPEKIEPPTVEKIELKNDQDGKPFFLLEVKIPQSVLELDKTRPTDGAVFLDYYLSIDKGEFQKWDGGYLDVLTEDEASALAGKAGSYLHSVYPVTDDSMDANEVSKHTYDLKLQLSYKYNYGEGPGEWDYVYSAFSNQVAIGAVAPEKTAEPPQVVSTPVAQTPPSAVAPAVSATAVPAISPAGSVNKTKAKLDDVPKTGDDRPLYLEFSAAMLFLGATFIFAKRALKKA